MSQKFICLKRIFCSVFFFKEMAQSKMTYSFEDMTTCELREILEDCDYDRKMLLRRARGREFTDSEKKEMDYLDAWAAKVWGEIMRRRGPRPEEAKTDS
jgi:hypothetical protein